MPGSGANVGFDPYPTQLSDYAIPILVYRFDRSREVGERYRSIPNVYCRGIQRREGAEPSVARFEYVFDDTDPTSEIPSQFDQVWPIGSKGPYVVEPDMEIVVIGIAASGKGRALFHGHAQVPQVDVQPMGQSVTFIALGVEARAWDTPIGGRIERNADAPDSTASNDQVQTDWPTRFNPADQAGVTANCTGDDDDIEPTGPEDGYPVFLDPAIIRTPLPQTFWDVGKAIRYILATQNLQDGDPVWIKNPDFTHIDSRMWPRTPIEAEFYDPGDFTTYETSPVVIRDYNATNRAWPEVVAELAGFAGAVIQFDLTMDENDEPLTTLRFRRGDATTSVPTKDVYLQPLYETLDPALTNVQDLHIARDAIHLANAFEIETDPVSYEVSIVLAPGFTPAAGDAAAGALKDFLLSNLKVSGASATKRQKYRLYVADEAGDGHWDGATFVSGANVALNLSSVFGDPDQGGTPQYVRRLRKPDSFLFSKDAAQKRLRATLSLSRDYAGAHPAVWDGTGHWHPITGGWELLKDRLGINVTIEDPEAWDIGKYAGSDPQNPNRTLRGITSQADPSSTEQNTKRFYLRLTCVIESDAMIDAEAPVRDASPTEFERRRRIDCKDHFRREVIHDSSQFFDEDSDPDGEGFFDSRDDTSKAQAHAQTLRAAHEFPPLNGSVTIPWLANGYNLGDRIRSIAGRDVSLQTNAGTQSGEAPRYPYVVGIDWDFSGEAQRTMLHYSDRRLEPQRQ